MNEKAKKAVGTEQGPASEDRKKRGVFGTINDVTRVALMRAPVPMAFLTGIAVIEADEHIVRPVGQRVINGVKKLAGAVTKGSGEAVAEEATSDGARQAVSGVATASKLYAQAIPIPIPIQPGGLGLGIRRAGQVVIEDVGRQTVTETTKNAVAGGGGFVIAALQAIAKAFSG